MWASEAQKGTISMMKYEEGALPFSGNVTWRNVSEAGAARLLVGNQSATKKRGC